MFTLTHSYVQISCLCLVELRYSKNAGYSHMTKDRFDSLTKAEAPNPCGVQLSLTRQINSFLSQQMDTSFP